MAGRSPSLRAKRSNLPRSNGEHPPRTTDPMNPWLRRLARLIVILAIAAVLVVLFAGSEVVPAFALYLGLALLCLPAALLLRRRRRRSDGARLDLRPRD